MSTKNFSSFENLVNLFTSISNKLKNKVEKTLLKDTVGWIYKNQLYIPSTVTTQVSSGLTYTITRNNEGEVIEIDANGTPSNDAFLRLNACFPVSNGNYILSDGRNDDTNTTHKLFFTVMDADGTTEHGNIGDTTSNNGRFTKDSQYPNGRVTLVIRKDFVCDHLKFYPMLRDASVSDGTFEPAHKSVINLVGGLATLLTNKKENIVEAINDGYQTNLEMLKDTAGWVNKNIFEFSNNNVLERYRVNDSLSETGIKLVSDGQIGYSHIDYTVPKIEKDKEYVIDFDVAWLKGVARIEISRKKTADAQYSGVWNSGDITSNKHVNGKFKITQDFDICKIRFLCTMATVEEGDVSFDNFMIVKSEVTDLTYESFHHTSEDYFNMFCNFFNKNGAKNLLTFPYYLKSRELDGLTAIVNNDGSILLNGTLTANQTLCLHQRTKEQCKIYMPNGKYKLFIYVSDNNIINTTNAYIDTTYNNNWKVLFDGIKFNKEYTFEISDNTQTDIIDEHNEKGIGISLYFPKNLVLNNVLIRPMIYDASSIDNTFSSFAMNNRQLTNNKYDKSEQLLNGANNIFPDLNFMKIDIYNNATFEYDAIDRSFVIHPQGSESANSGVFISQSLLRPLFSRYINTDAVISFDIKGDAEFTVVAGVEGYSYNKMTVTEEWQRAERFILDLSTIGSLIFYGFRESANNHSIYIKNIMISLSSTEYTQPSMTNIDMAPIQSQVDTTFPINFHVNTIVKQGYLVYLKLRLKVTDTAASAVVGNVPVGFRPMGDSMRAVCMLDDWTLEPISVQYNGDIIVHNAISGTKDLDIYCMWSIANNVQY